LIGGQEDMAQQRKSTYLQIKVTPEFKAEVLKYCDDTGRTITSLIEWLLKEEMKKAAEK
jgi:hypothetical protein